LNIRESLRKNLTETEKIFWDALRNRRLGGVKFRRQHPIGAYIADFFCAEAGLVIELDGGIHQQADQEQRDRLRDEAMQAHNLRVMRFTNEEVLKGQAAVLEQIQRALITEKEKE
jgi:very-short-patch-repair endonuclease